jgi:hypothetical protein
VSQDTDGRMDVYEWERDGTHGCDQEAGCISLLSGGRGPTASWLIGSSRSGNDVFMITRTQLTQEDGNEFYDVYDARVNGGHPASPVCTGTGCQGLPAPPPTFATPASVTYEGIGNFPPPATSAIGVRASAKPHGLTRAQKLERALRACGRQPRKRRASCRAAAKRQFGAQARKTTKSATGRK